MNSSSFTRLRSLSSLLQLVCLVVFASTSWHTTPVVNATFIIDNHAPNPTTPTTNRISPAILPRSSSATKSSHQRHQYHRTPSLLSPTNTGPSSPSSSSSSLSARPKRQPKERSSSSGPAYTVEDPTAFLGNFRFVVPALFLAQIIFLAAAQLTSGNENLEIYGNKGNAYIRSNGGYDMSKSIFERVGIQSKGQQIWYNNVFRDLKNSGPVYPPISEP